MITALAGGAAHDPLLDDAGQVRRPLVVVDLDEPVPADVVHAATRTARSCERILVGVATRAIDDERWALADALDLTFAADGCARGPQFAASDDPAGDADVLCQAAEANPRAALVLVQVLRASGRLDVAAALDVESFAYSTLLGGPEFVRWLRGRGDRPLPPPATEPPVLLTREGDVVRVTLNRPERRNAYGREMRDALVDALAVAAAEECRVVLDGAGPAFCSGGDLDEFGTTPDPVTAHFVRTRAGAARALHAIAGRAEVRVHGACVGAGLELAAFAGRVVARAGTVFRLPEVTMGLIPGAGGTVSVPRRIGRWRTLWPALSGRPLSAVTALDWGLVDAIEDGS
ncbi:enoyl-CoA hydratase [Amycolatopsis deserti]|uniref:Enoyl-CoA hydratase n=1 Tax=Amycolatopsis deserti TaxID=185696 RepID=A0ABQ3INJ9_9PSEU|nr:enoyl-CoA hydratase/isomerase family protein [Amycolatopsis deserti]GHE84923.1 enoyl-CoA hydratase [Amycolatopsis deserti]